MRFPASPRFARWLLGGVALFVTTTATVPAAPDRTAAQAVIDTTAGAVLDEFKARQLLPDQLAITFIDLRHPTHPDRGNYHGEAAIYPASVVKLFYLAAAHRWLEDGRIKDTPELRRALHDMIVDSSNDATSYVVDVLTGTTSGPELPDPELATWFEKRNAVNRYFADAGYAGINVNKKPWGDGPYGREVQAAQTFEQKRNLLTTDATARLLAEIARERCINADHSRQMLAILSRDLTHPDEQAQFTGDALPAGTKIWSKAGWTSQTRHDAMYVELPTGGKFVLVVFTTGHASDHGIIPAVTCHVVEAMSPPPR